MTVLISCMENFKTIHVNVDNKKKMKCNIIISR